MRVLGIDPGYERLGIAIVEKRENKDFLVYSECFQTSKELDFHERLLLLGNRVEEVIQTHQPTALAIETLMFNTNQKTAMNVAEARGIVIFQAIKKSLQIFEYTPLQIKIAITGYGRSDKNQVTEMVKRLIATEKRAMKDDEYDAIACAITCFASYKVQNRK
ncbi:MAG: crossover junction endodeoxyribonuclease RuvC [Candidatus Paceibacterota bacterium]|jgi:crossover junction endodeoxyribonuclease RuvC|nr:crossover junction endodeoxyribonuclease RuvC [Candidatus Paceibacterota bacterium]